MSKDRSPRFDCSRTMGTSCIASRMTWIPGGLQPPSGGHTHAAKVVIRAIAACVALNPMDDPEQRAALKPGLDLERDRAFRERSAFLAHSVADLHAGNGRDGLWLGEIRLRQPSLAKGRNG